MVSYGSTWKERELRNSISFFLFFFFSSIKLEFSIFARSLAALVSRILLKTTNRKLLV